MLRGLLVKFFLAVVIGQASADQANDTPQDEKPTVTFVWENDSFANTDRNYTNGVRLSWLSGTRPTDGVSEFIAETVLGAKENAVRRRGFAVGHSIFTPSDIESTRLLPKQHPYAGWLYGEFSGVVEQADAVDTFSIQLGIVGPSAGGEWVQNEFHSIIGIDGANGWDNQLEDELGVVISYDKKLRRIAQFGSSGFGADVTPSIGASIGNINTHVRAGLTLRVGQNLENDYGPPRIRPSLGGAGFFTPADNFSWYVFLGAEGRAVAHNIFNDGSLLRDDIVDLDRNLWVADYQGGLVVQLYHVQMALTLVERSREFSGQEEEQRFGAFSISRKF
ncbi:MAG: lipid A deacylase LpxR family protein [Henriciella sp.]|uniref:lipid A deacylase LpxR family protein n=1 Tax=Henriciella sp. TaxID=1968823 RepID=UPI003C772BDF